MSTNVSLAKAGRREWIGLGVIALPCLLYSMDLTVLNLAAPQISADLETSAAELLWIVDIYGFFVAGSLVTMGTLGDRIGRRKLLIIGAVAFGLASIFAAFSTSAGMLIAARAVLGVAAATLAPSTLSLIRNMFLDPGERTFAIGVWISSFSAGGAIGPLIGGLLLQYFWWGSVFLIAVPIMLLLLILAPILLPEYRDPNPGRLDLPSAALSLVAVLAAIYGLKHMAQDGFGWSPVAWILAGLTVGAIFARRQLTLADPLIDLKLFRVPALSAALAINIVGLFAAFGCFLFLAQYLQLILGMTPLEAGLWTAPSGLAFIAGSMLAPAMVRRVRPATVIACGFLVSALGFALLTQVDGPDTLWVLVSGLIVFCLGFAPVGTLTTDIVMSAAPPERAGAASAISETSFEFGGALGIAVLGSLLTALYGGAMAEAMPDGLTRAAADAARGTLPGALGAAAQLPGEAGARLASLARAAYGDAFVIVSILCAALCLAAAVMAALTLRRAGEPAPGHPSEPAACQGRA